MKEIKQEFPKELKSCMDIVEVIDRLLHETFPLKKLCLSYVESPYLEGLRISLVLKYIVLDGSFSHSRMPINTSSLQIGIPVYDENSVIIMSQSYLYYADSNSKEQSLIQLNKRFLEYLIKHIFYAKDTNFIDGRGKKKFCLSFQTILGLSNNIGGNGYK